MCLSVDVWVWVGVQFVFVGWLLSAVDGLSFVLRLLVVAVVCCCCCC